MDSAQQLYAISDAATEALARFRDKLPDQVIVDITDACSDINSSWSGSNLGYHASVYFGNLDRKVPGANFSPEWGLMDAYFEQRTHPQFREHDPSYVRASVLERAGGHDISDASGWSSASGKEFSALKRDALSVLAIEQEARGDAFLAEIGADIKDLAPINENEAYQQFYPRGQRMSRDTLAVTQGTRLAPHQELWAEMLTYSSLVGNLEEFSTLSRQAAAHINRRPENKRSRVSSKTVFIGHGRSPIWRELKDFIKDTLHLDVEEFGRIPTAGISTISRVSDMLDGAAFAFLVMTPEDETADGKMNPRLNVVHEAGLFQGRLGIQKAIIILEEGCEVFSNVDGVGQLRYPTGRMSAIFEDVRAVLLREGLFA